MKQGSATGAAPGPTLLATAAALVVIVFLIILYFTLMQKLVEFAALLIGTIAKM